jgi:uncharacterized membrane protein
MNLYFWSLVGVILFYLFLYVKKHTFDEHSRTKLTLPIWMILIVFVLCFVPILNIVLFVFALISYIREVNSYDGFISFQANSKFLKWLGEWLTKEV